MATAEENTVDQALRAQALNYAFQQPEEGKDPIDTAKTFYDFLSKGDPEERSNRSQAFSYALQRPQDKVSTLDRAKAFYTFITTGK